MELRNNHSHLFDCWIGLSWCSNFPKSNSVGEIAGHVVKQMDAI